MFLHITKDIRGNFRFYNGPRRMSLEEAVSRCPHEWVATFDKEAADFLAEKQKHQAERI